MWVALRIDTARRRREMLTVGVGCRGRRRLHRPRRSTRNDRYVLRHRQFEISRVLPPLLYTQAGVYTKIVDRTSALTRARLSRAVVGDAFGLDARCMVWDGATRAHDAACAPTLTKPRPARLTNDDRRPKTGQNAEYVSFRLVARFSPLPFDFSLVQSYKLSCSCSRGCMGAIVAHA